MAKIDSIYLEGTNGYSVLLCHPLAETPLLMKEFAKKLNKKGYTVSCPLYPGHGTTFEDLIDSTFHEWYQCLNDEYIKLKEHSEVFVCGMSIGGTMAVKLAEEHNPKAVATINAPVIGFDVVSDVYGLGLKSPNITKEQLEAYKAHRTIYFHEVINIGQVDNLKKIESPLFILQGSLDQPRYKTSSHMLMTYASSTIKQRKDYGRSKHMILLESDKKEAMKDIYQFFEDTK